MSNAPLPYHEKLIQTCNDLIMGDKLSEDYYIVTYKKKDWRARLNDGLDFPIRLPARLSHEIRCIHRTNDFLTFLS